MTSHKNAWALRRSRAGFTLIEVLVVVAIIIILLYAVIAVGSNIRAASMTRATEGTLHTLAMAAAEFKTQTGKEPSNTYGYFNDLKSNPQSLKNLNRLPASAWGSTSILDAWGNQIKYIRSGHYDNSLNYLGPLGGSIPVGTTATVPDGFFTSVGADGIANNTDDIRSTEAVK